jgi:hypothetical protein
MALEDRQIEAFERSGFLVLRGAIPADVVAACRADLATALRGAGVDPGDAGWHVDGSYEGADGTYWLNAASRDRGLLLLVLYDEVSADDAPTELKVGSHLDVPRVLQRYGARGESVFRVVPELPPSTYERPSAFATGAPGDVFVCHPFLVHRATWPHRGDRPRAMAQPGVATVEEFRLDGVDPCPVERAILAGLAGEARAG